MSDNGSRLLRKEQAHHERAFEFYCSLGEHRSYDKVAKEFIVARSTVRLWGKSFAWKDRLQKRDTQLARELASRTFTDEVSRRERSLQIVQMGLLSVAKAITEGEVKATMADLDRLIRLEAFLSNEPDSRQEVVFADLKGKSAAELKAMIRAEMTILRELTEG